MGFAKTGGALSVAVGLVVSGSKKESSFMRNWNKEPKKVRVKSKYLGQGQSPVLEVR